MLQRFEQFTSIISALCRDVQRIEREEMEKQGLRGAFAQYLLAISLHPEGITASELCEACDKDKAAVSRIIGEIESKGLLERENEGVGQYRAKLRLTAEGQAAAAFVRERISVVVALAGEGLSDEDRKVCYHTLEQISANLQRICKKGTL